MANPQKENGFTAIANEIMEKLYSIPLSGSEYRILFCIIRKTYGWNKKADKISLSQLVTETKLSRKQVCESINKLVTKRLLFRDRKFINEYSFNKNYEQWLVTERLIGSYGTVTKTSYQTVNEVVTEMEHTIDINTKDNKEINTKEKEKFLLNLNKLRRGEKVN
jgi:phage replication O-like protein O